MSDRRLWSMGTVGHLLVEPDDERLLDAAADELERLEALWSRFRPESDLSRLNRSAGEPTEVDTETVELIDLALQAWAWTQGLFDPTVHDAVVAAGYDRTFELVADLPGPPTPVGPAPGPAGVQLDAEHRRVTVPAGLHLDLGGIGKGRAADLVAAHLSTSGASGALVSLGGDVRVTGRPAEGGPWRVAVSSPFDPTGHLCTVRIASGAVATSTTTKRTWIRDGVRAHHLIDPRTGRPSATALTSATVIASEAMWAEVAAKTAIIAGRDEGPALVERAGLAGLFVDDAGTLLATPSFAEHLEPDGTGGLDLLEVLT